MPVIITAGSGQPWETEVVAELGAAAHPSGLKVLKRCVDVSEILAIAATGQVAAAIMSAGLRRLDSEVIAHLRRHRVAVIAVYPAGEDRWLRMLDLVGVDAAVPSDSGCQAMIAAIVRALAAGGDGGPPGESDGQQRRTVVSAGLSAGSPAGLPGARSGSGSDAGATDPESAAATDRDNNDETGRGSTGRGSAGVTAGGAAGNTAGGAAEDTAGETAAGRDGPGETAGETAAENAAGEATSDMPGPGTPHPDASRAGGRVARKAASAGSPRFVPRSGDASDGAAVRGHQPEGGARFRFSRPGSSSRGRHQAAVTDSDPQPRGAAPSKRAVWDGAPEAPDRPPPGSTIAVWGPHGSPGRTTIAMGLADRLAERGSRVLLIDADVYGGVLANAFGLLDESAGLAGACRLASVGKLTAAGLASLCWDVGGGMTLLTGIPRADRWPELRPSAIPAVLGCAAELADIVILDCSALLESDEELSFDTLAPRRNGATLAVLSAASAVLAVAAADPPGMERFARAFPEVTAVCGSGAPWVVCNRVRPTAGGGGQARAATLRFCGVEPIAMIPEDRAALDLAWARGERLSQVASRSPLVAAFEELAAQLEPRLASCATMAL